MLLRKKYNGLGRGKSRKKNRIYLMIAVIVLSCNDAQYAKDCIESVVLMSNNETPQEIILVDNGCDQANRAILESISFVNRRIRRETNLGLPVGYNIGIADAIERGSDYVCLLNADTKIETRGWLKNMLGIIECHEKVGMVAAMTNKIANKVQNWKRYGCKLPGTALKAKWVGLGMTLIPAGVIREAGYLDENMTPGGGVDVEYSLRVRNLGYELYVDGNTYVWHKGKVAFKLLKTPYNYYNKRNIVYIKKKHPTTWKKVL